MCLKKCSGTRRHARFARGGLRGRGMQRDAKRFCLVDNYSYFFPFSLAIHSRHTIRHTICPRGAIQPAIHPNRRTRFRSDVRSTCVLRTRPRAGAEWGAEGRTRGGVAGRVRRTHVLRTSLLKRVRRFGWMAGWMAPPGPDRRMICMAGVSEEIARDSSTCSLRSRRASLPWDAARREAFLFG